MEKKTVTIIASILLLWTIIFVAAIPYLTKTIPMSGTVPELKFSIVINGSPWNNGDMFNWTTLDFGSNIMPITITNIGSLDFTVNMTSPNLPTDWLLTWNLEGALVIVGGFITGDLTLTVPDSATQGQQYFWNMVITATA